MAYIGKKPTDVPLSSADIADEIIDSDAYVDGSIDNAHIADDAIDSEHYVNGSIDLAHLSADCVDGTKLADNAVDSEHYTDGSIDNAHIADDAIDSEHYAAGSIDTAHIATNQIDETRMKDAFVGDFTDATVTASDYFLHGDATDSGKTKKDTVQGILDLAGGGGAWTYISTVTASGASTVDFFGLATGTYDVFACWFSGVWPSTDANITFRMYEAGGPSVDSGSVYYGFVKHT